MKTSLFDLYKIGIGPSSSHTMGPMRAARRFARSLHSSGQLDQVAAIHTSCTAPSLSPDTATAPTAPSCSVSAEKRPQPSTPPPSTQNSPPSAPQRRCLSSARTPFPSTKPDDLLFHRDQMFPPGAKTQHPNGIRFTAFDSNGKVLASEIYFSIGGGFIVADSEPNARDFARTHRRCISSRAALSIQERRRPAENRGRK